VVTDCVEITAVVKTVDRTGVEMEALTAASVAGLTVIDMIKALDPAATITNVQMTAKSGGRNGEWHRN
jgi:cyclic pyranopterin phosphate synthase